MTITINGSGTITGASTLATTVASPTFTTPNIDSAQFATVSGTAPIYACRAWVNFNGTGTVAIRASGNVSSITDNGTGDYTVNFTTAMPDVNYVTIATSSQNAAANPASYSAGIPDNNGALLYSTTQVRVSAKVASGGTLVDVPVFCVSIFR
jgi:hypothetical protein